MNKFILATNSLMQEFGFKTTTDFASSTFGFAVKKTVLSLSVFFGVLSTLVQDFVGIDSYVFLAFIALIFIEFRTGIKASIKHGKKIQSKRIGRVVLKMLTYTLIIGIINIFSTRLFVPNIFGFEINIYSVIHYAVLSLIIFQLLLSVFENLSKLGYEESSKIFKFLKYKGKSWFSFDKSELDELDK